MLQSGNRDHQTTCVHRLTPASAMQKPTDKAIWRSCQGLRHGQQQNGMRTLLQSHIRVLLSDIKHVPRLLQFMGQLYLEMDMVYLQVLESSPFTPTNHLPAQQIEDVSEGRLWSGSGLESYWIATFAKSHHHALAY